MLQFENAYFVDLDKGPVVDQLRKPMHYGDDKANRIGVTVTKNGQAVTLSGECTGKAVLGDDTWVMITNGVVDGNEAYIELPSACYSIEGPIRIFLNISSGDTEITLLDLTGYVKATQTDSAIDPDHPTFSVSALEYIITTGAQDQIDAIEEAGAAQMDAIEDKGEEVIASIPSDYTSIVQQAEDTLDQAEALIDAVDDIVLVQSTEPVEEHNKIWVNGDSSSAVQVPTYAEFEAVNASKADTDGSYENMTVGNAEQLVSTVGIEDKVPYLFRTSGGTADIGDREVDKIVGGTVAWNQLVTTTGNWPNSDNGVGTRNGANVTVTPNTANKKYAAAAATAIKYYYPYHVYYLHYKVTEMSANVTSAGVGFNGAPVSVTAPGEKSFIYKVTSNRLSVQAVISGPENLATTEYAVFTDTVCCDLTQMLGSTIADYIYSLETATPGAGVEWFRKLFPKDYYAYNPGELISVSGLQSHDITGFNAYDPDSGKAHVVGGMEYQVTGTYTALTIDGTSIAPDSNGKFTPANNGELTVTGGDGTTCIHLVWDSERNGEYEPYKLNSYPLDSSLTLRGIPKLDTNNKLYYDGDTYESDGTVTRRYGIVDLGTLNWIAYASDTTGKNRFSADLSDIKIGYFSQVNILCSEYEKIDSTYRYGSRGIAPHETESKLLAADPAKAEMSGAEFKSSMSGVYLVYELATPTTESATPYQNPQIVDNFGTEEYVTDSIVPVGHETTYRANLRAKLEMAPDSPDGDGDYIVRQTNGQNSYVPLAIPNELPALPSTDGTYKLQATVADGTPTLNWQDSSGEIWHEADLTEANYDPTLKMIVFDAGEGNAIKEIIAAGQIVNDGTQSADEKIAFGLGTTNGRRFYSCPNETNNIASTSRSIGFVCHFRRISTPPIPGGGVLGYTIFPNAFFYGASSSSMHSISVDLGMASQGPQRATNFYRDSFANPRYFKIELPTWVPEWADIKIRYTLEG